MTATITPPAVAHRGPRRAGPESSSEITAPLPIAPAVAPSPRLLTGGHHRPAARRPWRRLLLALLVVAALAGTAAGAYLLGARANAPVAVAPTAAATPVAPAPTPSASAAPTGATLVDEDGTPVDAAVAAHVRAVYRALDTGNIAPIRDAYAADGSDDGLTVEPHLRKSTVRTKLLTALRTKPTHDGIEYRYTKAGYALEFNQAENTSQMPAGLGRITGPWTTTDAATTSTAEPSDAAATKERTTSESGSESESPSTSTSSQNTSSTSSGTTSCSKGTHPGGDGLYPCTDNATGAAVGPDGTFGVHGLKPCPPGTDTTDGIGRTPETDAVCATP